MNARLALALAAILAAAALAGCVDAAGSLEMDRVNDSALAEQASVPTSGGDHPHEIEQRALARELISNGSFEVSELEPPIETGLAHEYQGAYYNLSAETVGSTPGVVTLVSVDYNATDPTGERIAFGDLSRHEQTELRSILTFEPPRLRNGTEADTLLTLTDSQRAGAVLEAYGGGSVVLTRNGESYHLRIDRFNEDTLTTYRYEATKIAGGERAYARHLKQRYAFTLENLNENESAVVDEALDDTYYPESTDDAGFDSLVDRFLGHRAVQRDDYSGNWLVRYDGRLYWVDLDFGAFVESETISSPAVTPN